MTSLRDHSYTRLLLASLLICWITGLLLALDIYPGSPFGPDWRMIADGQLFLMAGFFLIIPAGLVALFLVWPILLFLTQVVRRVEPIVPAKWNWPYWLGSGAIAGPFALFILSFPIGLGRTLIANLILSGMLCGAACAALVRWLIGPEVDDMAAVVHPEASDDIP